MSEPVWTVLVRAFGPKTLDEKSGTYLVAATDPGLATRRAFQFWRADNKGMVVSRVWFEVSKV